MIANILFTSGMALMEKGLDAAALRNTVIANNLANVDTPGYKRSEVAFEDVFRKALNGKSGLKGAVTNERHIPIGGQKNIAGVNPRVLVQNESTMRNDGNNVDIDREMAAMAKNSIVYNALAQEISGDFQKMKQAISGQ